MKFFSVFLILFAVQPLSAAIIHPENGASIPEPVLTDYSEGNRSPGIMGVPQDVQDASGKEVAY